jgi:flagellar biosynthesis regulator FlbT
VISAPDIRRTVREVMQFIRDNDLYDLVAIIDGEEVSGNDLLEDLKLAESLLYLEEQRQSEAERVAAIARADV